jgi:tetratricopeptide (TPR) repeat protein
MVAAKKISKKKLKEPDEFITFTERTFLFVRKHLREVVIGTSVVVAIVIALSLFQMWEKRKEAEAQVTFASAMEAYQKATSSYGETTGQGLKEALGKLEEVAKRYPRTGPGKLSYLYQGNLHLRQGSYDEAIKAFTTFLDKGGQEKLLRAFATEGLAYAYEGKKDFAKALEYYQRAIESAESLPMQNAHLGAGRCFERLGKREEALASYRAYLKAAQKSQESNMVEHRVALLEAKK